jgi:hypothetical protein
MKVVGQYQHIMAMQQIFNDRSHDSPIDAISKCVPSSIQLSKEDFNIKNSTQKKSLYGMILEILKSLSGRQDL